MGLLDTGDKLPTVKEAVTMIAVNPNTVVKAYKELERMGLVEGRAGIGTFVTDRASGGPSPPIRTALGRELAIWMSCARHAGLDEESIEAMFHLTLHNIVEGGADETENQH
jgi:GntR family transcriptional regulator